MPETDSELRALREEVARLQRQVAFLSKHRTLAAGMTGETLVASLLDGEVSAEAVGFGVVSGKGHRIKVKTARLTAGDSSFRSRRWQWAKILGENGMSQYDYLVLVGEANDRFAELYRNGGAPFVFFLIPYDKVFGLTTGGEKTRRSILLSSDPRCPRSPAAVRLYNEFQVGPDELRQRIGV